MNALDVADRIDFIARMMARNSILPSQSAEIAAELAGCASDIRNIHCAAQDKKFNNRRAS